MTRFIPYGAGSSCRALFISIPLMQILDPQYLATMNFEIAQEIINHGNADQSMTDPSLSQLLKTNGVANVTAHIEKLSTFDLIADAQPGKGADGKGWIFYSLTNLAIECKGDAEKLRELVIKASEPPLNEIAQAIKNLADMCDGANINHNFKADYIRTLDEIAICFNHDCYIATISLCGKILEISLTDILQQNGIDTSNIRMIGQLIHAARENLNLRYIDNTFYDVARIISKSRNSAVHFNDGIPVPTRDQAVMVNFATRHFVTNYIQ